jgi:outer membrane biosynthesis protein TonB
MESKERKIFTYAVIISLLIHILGFLLMNYSNLLSFTIPEDYQPEQDYQPIVLEFEQPPVVQQPEPEPEQATPPPEDYYLVEENPNANEMDPVESNILAAKSSISAAPQQAEIERSSLPAEKPNLEPPEETQLAEEDPGVETQDLAGNVTVFNKKQFSKSLLTNQPTPNKEELKKDSLSSEPVSLMDEFKGDLVGAFALSTYEWKWAPWFLEFEKKFHRNVYVPAAYQMGLIDGYTELWFKVDRNGNLMDYKLLKYVGHSTLKESTINAVVNSAPWNPLPSDFPDEYLELRVRFIYPNLKELFEKYQSSNKQ